MNGETLVTLLQELNGGASIGSTLAYQLLNLAKAMVERRRPWTILRDTDTSKTVTTGTTWQTAIDLSTITRFNRFYGDTPIKLFDGNQRIDYFRQRPFNKRLENKDATGTFVFKESSKTLYLNGTPQFNGTLWIDHIVDSADIAAATTWVFPTYAHPLLAFYAIGIHKGGIDYDDVNARMAPDNRAQAAAIMNTLEHWDGDLQLAETQNDDPSGSADDGSRHGVVNMNA